MPQPARVEEQHYPEDARPEGRLSLPPVRAEDLAGMRRVGQVAYTPGILPYWGDQLRHHGEVETEIPVRDAVAAAELCALNALSAIRAQVGSLDRVEAVLQLVVMVCCPPGFEGTARVADGASGALFEVLGSRGRHRREVVATRELPGGAPVQVTVVFRVD
jgi:enamine deaminase RidA (YjgF/YER057c/UK114 family)